MSFLTSADRAAILSRLGNLSLARKLLRGAVGDSHLAVTLSANTTLTKASHFTHRIVRFDPGGSARTLTLPAEADMDGFVGILVNGADDDEALTIKDDSGETTIATVEQNEAVLLACDGTSWLGAKLLMSGIT